MNKKLPKCKQCGERFMPFYNNSLQKYCMKKDDCIKAHTEHAKTQRQKQKKREHKQAKQKLETHGQVAAKLQAPINKIARLIDAGTPCMMCNNPKMKRINGCHYHSVGSNATLRFNLLNIFHGCHSCNSGKGGNITGYDEQLINTFGKQFWEYVKFELLQTDPIHLSKDDMRSLTTEANKIVRELEKMELKNLSSENRIKFRKKINERLGIYPKK